MAKIRNWCFIHLCVKDLFPGFKQNSILRFSKLFPIKDSYTPRPWRALAKRREKELGEGNSEQGSVKKRRGWAPDYAPVPTDPALVMECDSVKFHKAAELKKEYEEEKDDKEAATKAPKLTDWRWGPAQYWYDKEGLPDICPDYDYGLRVRNVEEQTELDTAVAGITMDNVKSGRLDLEGAAGTTGV